MARRASPDTVAAPRVLLALCALAALGLVGTACSDGDTQGRPSSSPTDVAPESTTASATASSTTASIATTSGTTTSIAVTTVPVDSRADLERLRADAEAFSAAYHGSWPDIDGALARFADDFVFYDPADGDFLIEGAGAIVPEIRNFARYYAGVEITLDEVFLSADAAAFRTSASHGYWPPWGGIEPAEHEPVVGLDVFHFEGDSVTGFDIWFGDDSLDLMRFGCFTTDGCPELTAIAQRYVAAWESGDEDRIAALYADDATFSDTLLGVLASGPSEIAATAEERFGRSDPRIEIVELFAQTNGPGAPSDIAPERGRIIAVAIHYRVSSTEPNTPGFEGLTTFELGTRRSDGFTRDPDLLITREEVFQDPDALPPLMR